MPIKSSFEVITGETLTTLSTSKIISSTVNEINVGPVPERKES